MKNSAADSIFIDYNDERIQELMKTEFISKHWFYLPFIGSQFFDKGNVKILFVAESHYLSKESSFYKKYKKYNECEVSEKEEWLRKNWYDKHYPCLADENNLPKEYENLDLYYVWTTQVIKNNCISPDKSCITLFRRILYPLWLVQNKTLVEIESEKVRKGNKFELNDKGKIKAVLKTTAYMNYFIRPSEKNAKSIDLKEIDKERAFENFKEVWKLLDKPYVVFVSKKAHDAFKESAKNTKDKDMDMEERNAIVLPHPVSPWWYRKRKDGKTGWLEEVKFFVEKFKKIE